MKTVIMFQGNGMPQYTEDFPEPIVKNEDEILISVKAAAFKNLDKSMASGKHYTTEGDIQLAKVIGGDGVGLLANGRRVYALGVSGMMAEKAVVEKSRMIEIPEGLDDITAAALPNAVAGSAMALRFRAAIQPGETVLINGATGFTGKTAVQIAKYYGAGKIIVTGRNEQTLQLLLPLGADEIVSVSQNDESFIAQIKQIHNNTPIDIVIDYLWGHSAELILETLKGKGGFTHRTRFVSIGSITGDKIQLSSEILRSVDLQLSGSGMGSWTKEEMQKLLKEIVPEMFRLAADNKLKLETLNISLMDIDKLWELEVTDGKRLVVTM
ncbi:zinc-binding alcohol dehydrogenase family protein [uncultured Bacteroides sp.]|uniref:quinone oxidoreductase family protein n=1 Tax=uncultured Bacteroides sp. TaxID=162156 RepID=UPI002AA77CF6|nr:zinc-binding alcohol dehydrogenase family protein [uncultured Bacteroides sp.]